MQSRSVQHSALVMQLLLTPHCRCPPGHEHVPPGPEHTSPVTVQSEVVQHSALGMQVLFAEQTL